MASLGTELPQEIDRVRKLQDQYKELRSHKNVIVEPQIAMMEVAITEGLNAIASDDVVRMLRAYEALKGFEE